MEHASPKTAPWRDIYSVSRLNREAKALLERGFPPIWIEGELSNVSRPASGHVYFSLKDAQSQVRCCYFRQHQRSSGLALRDGLHVLARARVSLYEGRGDYQIIVEYLEEAGEGALRRAFDALKLRLSQEGLFDAAHKRPLPRLPRRIGVVTSPSGAVLHDIVTTLRRRFPSIGVVVYPVPVQGDGAAEQIVAALQIAGKRNECDALILARGGGSLEDLWPFSDERVARAIHACPIPIVSGVGHETDFTIADMVADARAPTPTAAAEMLSPDRAEWLASFVRLQTRLRTALRSGLRERQQRLDWLSAKLVHPRHRLSLLQQQLDACRRRLSLAQTRSLQQTRMALNAAAARLSHHGLLARLHTLSRQHHAVTRRLTEAVRRNLERKQAALRGLAQTLHALSPLATLARGYAIVQRAAGDVLNDATSVTPGERVHARLARGRLTCVVEATRDE